MREPTFYIGIILLLLSAAVVYCVRRFSVGRQDDTATSDAAEKSGRKPSPTRTTYHRKYNGGKRFVKAPRV